MERNCLMGTEFYLRVMESKSVWIVETETWLRWVGAYTGSDKKMAADVQNIIFQFLGFKKKGKDTANSRGGYSVIGRFRGHRKALQRREKFKIEKKEGVMNGIRSWICRR